MFRQNAILFQARAFGETTATAALLRNASCSEPSACWCSREHLNHILHNASHQRVTASNVSTARHADPLLCCMRWLRVVII